MIFIHHKKIHIMLLCGGGVKIRRWWRQKEINLPMARVSSTWERRERETSTNNHVIRSGGNVGVCICLFILFLENESWWATVVRLLLPGAIGRVCTSDLNNNSFVETIALMSNKIHIHIKKVLKHISTIKITFICSVQFCFKFNTTEEKSISKTYSLSYTIISWNYLRLNKSSVKFRTISIIYVWYLTATTLPKVFAFKFTKRENIGRFDLFIIIDMDNSMNTLYVLYATTREIKAYTTI